MDKSGVSSHQNRLEPTFDQIERTRLAALRILEARACSAAELNERLKKRKLAAAAIEHVVGRLVETGVVNDERLAEHVVERELRSRPAGDALLRGKLEARSVDGDIASAAVGRVSSQHTELERATELANRTALALSRRLDQHARWRRVLSVLARRGFDEDVAVEAAEAALGPIPEEP